ncbi:MAG: hypothetical protein ACRC14_11995 [Paracoccaceae bacterium]
MSQKPEAGMTARQALRIEFGIIGLGVLGLAMIFQPFVLWIFSIGCILVLVGTLINNLLPFAQPGLPLRGVLFAGAIVMLVFCLVLLISIGSAALYGVVFLTPPPAGSSLVPPSPPFWMHPMIWVLAGLSVLFAFLVRQLARS